MHEYVWAFMNTYQQDIEIKENCSAELLKKGGSRHSFIVPKVASEMLYSTIWYCIV